MSHRIDILDRNLAYVATIRNTPPLDKDGYYLHWTERLNNWETCTFRVGRDDPLFVSEGDITKRFRYHVRIYDNNAIAFQGVIVKRPRRNARFIEVVAYSYEYLMSRVLINHDAPDGNGAENYRAFKSGTMRENILALVSEAKVRMGQPLANLTIGDVQNPSFPADFKDASGNALSGAWTFSDSFRLQLDYRDLWYTLRIFAMYCNYDLEVTNEFVLNFVPKIGNDKTNLMFTYGEFGNIEDYEAPEDGDAMANFLQGVAADNADQLIHAEQSDPESIELDGRIEAVAAYGDVKNTSLLNERLKQEIAQVKSGDPELVFYPNKRAYPRGVWGIGDTVRVKIDEVGSDSLRRIVGIDYWVHQSGKTKVRVITNKPKIG